METSNFPAGLENCKGGNCPTQNLVDAYEMADGKPWDQSAFYAPANPYANRDPRLAATIAVNGETGWPAWNEAPLETFQGGANGEPVNGGTPTGYYLKKYCQGNIDPRSNSTNKSAYHTWITFRLGEFYLNYAEAVFHYLGSADATSAEFPLSAREAASRTRARKSVNMPPFPTGMSNDEFWTKYKNERMVELAFEGHRFWDVRRWKEADKYFRSITEMKITRQTDGTFAYTRKEVARQWDDKMYFFPIPQADKLKNPNLGQNPGWGD